MKHLSKIFALLLPLALLFCLPCGAVSTRPVTLDRLGLTFRVPSSFTAVSVEESADAEVQYYLDKLGYYFYAYADEGEGAVSLTLYEPWENVSGLDKLSESRKTAYLSDLKSHLSRSGIYISESRVSGDYAVLTGMTVNQATGVILSETVVSTIRGDTEFLFIYTDSYYNTAQMSGDDIIAGISFQKNGLFQGGAFSPLSSPAAVIALLFFSLLVLAGGIVAIVLGVSHSRKRRVLAMAQYYRAQGAPLTWPPPYAGPTPPKGGASPPPLGGVPCYGAVPQQFPASSGTPPLSPPPAQRGPEGNPPHPPGR